MEGFKDELQINTNINKQMNAQAQRMEQKDRNLIIPEQNIGQVQGNAVQNAGVAQIQRPAYLTRLSELLTEYRSCGNSDDEGTFKPIARPLSYLVRNFESLNGKQEVKMIIDLYARANAYYNTHRGVRLSIGGRKRKNLINNIISCCEDAIMSMPDSMKADALEMMYSSDSAPIMFEKEEEHREGSLNNSKKADEFLKRIARAELKNSIRDRDIKDSDLLNTEPMTDAELDAVTDSTLSSFGKAETMLMLQQVIAKANKSRIYNIIPEGELEGYFANSKYGDDAIRLAKLYAKRVFFGRDGRPANYDSEVALKNAKEDIENLKSGDTAVMMATIDRHINEFMAIKLPTPDEITEDYIVNNMPKLLRLVALNINFDNIFNNTKNRNKNDEESSVNDMMEKSYPIELIKVLEQRRNIATSLTNVLSSYIASKNFGNINEINYVYGMEYNPLVNNFSIKYHRTEYKGDYDKNSLYLDMKFKARRDRLTKSGKAAEGLKYILQPNSVSKEDEQNYISIKTAHSNSMKAYSDKWSGAIASRHNIFSSIGGTGLFSRELQGFLNYAQELTDEQALANEQFITAYAEGDEKVLKEFGNQIVDNILNMSINPIDYINIGTPMFNMVHRYVHIFNDFAKNKLINKVLSDNPQKLQIAKQKAAVIGNIISISTISLQLNNFHGNVAVKASDKDISAAKRNLLEGYNIEKQELDRIKEQMKEYDKAHNTNYASYIDEEKRNPEFAPKLVPVEVENIEIPEEKIKIRLSDELEKNEKILKNKAVGYKSMLDNSDTLKTQLKSYAKKISFAYDPDTKMLRYGVVAKLVESGTIEQKAALFLELTRIIEVLRAGIKDEAVVETPIMLEYRKSYEKLKQQIEQADENTAASYAFYFVSRECVSMQQVADRYNLKYEELKKNNQNKSEEDLKKEAQLATITNNIKETENAMNAMNLVVARKTLGILNEDSIVGKTIKYYQSLAKRYKHLNEARKLTDEKMPNDVIVKKEDLENRVKSNFVSQRFLEVYPEMSKEDVNTIREKHLQRIELHKEIKEELNIKFVNNNEEDNEEENAEENRIIYLDVMEYVEPAKSIAKEFSDEDSEVKVSAETKKLTDTFDSFRTKDPIVNDGLYSIPSMSECKRIVASGTPEEKTALLLSLTDLLNLRSVRVGYRSEWNEYKDYAMPTELFNSLEKLQTDLMNGLNTPEFSEDKVKILKLLAAFKIESARNVADKYQRILNDKGKTLENVSEEEKKEISKSMANEEGEDYMLSLILSDKMQIQMPDIAQLQDYIINSTKQNYDNDSMWETLNKGFRWYRLADNIDGEGYKLKNMGLFATIYDITLNQFHKKLVEVANMSSSHNSNNADTLKNLVIDPLERLIALANSDDDNSNVAYKNQVLVLGKGVSKYIEIHQNPSSTKGQKRLELVQGLKETLSNPKFYDYVELK